MAGVFEHHDRSKFETSRSPWRTPGRDACAARRAFEPFSMSEPRPTRKRLSCCTGWRSTSPRPEATPNIAATHPARRPAPVQVNYLGFAGTLGADCIDYIIADRMSSRGPRRHYAEHIVCLPDCYLPNDSSRRMAEPPSRRASGLPDEGFVFCSFNQPYKSHPGDLRSLDAPLARGDGSVLWLPDARLLRSRT